MAPIVLLINATKVAGVVGALTVAANTLAFRHFYKKNLIPFDDPVDESQEVLASFPIDKSGTVVVAEGFWKWNLVYFVIIFVSVWVILCHFVSLRAKICFLC